VVRTLRDEGRAAGPPLPDDPIGGSPSLTRVAYSGEPGAFAEDAVIMAFDRPAPVPVPGFREVFEAVTAGRAPGDPPHAPLVAAGVVPVENLVSGTVRENYDLLLEHDLVVTGEVVVPVRLCLAALPGQSLDEIERVYSHVQALAQAEDFLRTRPWTLLTTYNTAGAARMIADRGERAAGAVVSPRAAAVFGLDILAEGIQQVSDNRTRFLVIARSESVAAVEAEVARVAARRVTAVPQGRPPGGEPQAAGMPGSGGRAAPRPQSGGRPAASGTAQRHGGDVSMRTTMVIAVRNVPGSLYRCLGVFARAGLNMSKLESRPGRDRAWEYVFWVDLDADAAQARQAAAELRPDASMVRILGTYPRAVDG